MATPIFICGAECGMATAGTAGVGIEHWSAVTGSPTVATSGPSSQRSPRAFRFNPTAATSFLTHTYTTAIASPSTSVGRFYVYFVSLPAADTRIWTGGVGCVVYKTTDHSLRAGGASTALTAASGVVITTGIWYRIDVKAVRNTTVTTDLSVDGSATTQYTVAGAAATTTTFTIGINDSTTADMYIDDIVMSGTSGDFPIGAGAVLGLYPNGDDSAGHIYNAAGDFGKAGTALTSLNATSSLETTSWQSLTNPLSTTIDNAKFISDQLGASTELLSWNFDDLSEVASISGLMVVTTNHAASTTACAVSGRINDGGTTNDIYTAADFSESTIVTAVKVYAVAPSSSAAWTKAKVDALKFQWGLATDVSPDPILDGVCFEVDCVPTKLGRSAAVTQAIQRGSFY